MTENEKKDKLFELNKAGLLSDSELAAELESIRHTNKKDKAKEKVKEQTKENKENVKKAFQNKDLEFKREVASRMTNKFGEPAYTKSEITNMSEKELNSIYSVVLQNKPDIIKQVELEWEQRLNKIKEKAKNKEELTPEERKELVVDKLVKKQEERGKIASEQAEKKEQEKEELEKAKKDLEPEKPKPVKEKKTANKTLKEVLKSETAKGIYAIVGSMAAIAILLATAPVALVAVGGALAAKEFMAGKKL